MQENKPHIGVLDGFRAWSVISLMCFHLWQQSWLGGIKVTLFNKTFEIMPREFLCSGSVWVDMLLLLSGFLLFLPYARQMAGENVQTDRPLHYYRKRIARIAPSVWFHIIILAVFIVRVSDYRSGGISLYFEDLIRNLLFMQDSPFPKYVYSKYTQTLWTLTVEVLFYLIFPLLGRIFKKHPIPTFIGMVGVSELFIRLYVIEQISSGNTLPHRMFPSYLGVYAVGMSTAVIYSYINAGKIKEKKWFTVIASVVSVIGIAVTIRMVWYGYGRDTTQLWQVKNRLLLAAVNGITVLSTCFAAKGIKLIFANPLTAFIAKISFNLYIWHQFFTVYLKKWHIPTYPEAPSGASAWPQSGSFEGHTEWQWKYTVIFWLVTFAVAILTTYLVEIPCNKLIMRNKKK